MGSKGGGLTDSSRRWNRIRYRSAEAQRHPKEKCNFASYGIAWEFLPQTGANPVLGDQSFGNRGAFETRADSVSTGDLSFQQDWPKTTTLVEPGHRHPAVALSFTPASFS